jgi:hypothetical protein
MSDHAATELPEIAFYYPGPFWGDDDAIKNLLLFFDAVGVLLPSYMKRHLERPELKLIRDLIDHKALQVFEPETLVDGPATRALATSLVDIIVSGAFDQLPNDHFVHASLSMSRLGFGGDLEIARWMHEELKARGLAGDSEDGLSIPMHHSVRSVILILLAQILRGPGRRLGYELVPATDRLVLVRALQELLSMKQAPSVGNVITMDTGIMGVDVSALPEVDPIV